MLALAHAPIQQDRNCNQIVQRVSSATSTHQLKRSKSSNKPSSRTSPIQTHHPIPPRDPPEPVQPKPAPAPTPSTAPAPPLPHLPLDPYQPFDINALPATELLPLLASLLQEIALANNHLHNLPENAFCPPSGSSEHLPRWNSLTSAARAALETPSSTRSFHADRPPQISLEAYLLRILKYCPTSNEVFLSLLVYFDRMSRLSTQATGRDFVIDSYNIHRLVIAGVTVASKFFSDVFYTNSRYAKVGGLPQLELNQLELQFLLLNDFQLAIPSDEMQHYATQLIAYSRESSLPSPISDKPLSPTHTGPRPPTNVEMVLGSVAAIQRQRSATDLDSSYDTEDETICPSHSSGASETSSLHTVRHEEDDGQE